MIPRRDASFERVRGRRNKEGSPRDSALASDVGRSSSCLLPLLRPFQGLLSRCQRSRASSSSELVRRAPDTFPAPAGSPSHSGVIGLSTAIRAQEAGYEVTIVAELFPGDEKSIRYTSAWAGAHHCSVATPDDPRQHRTS